MRHDLVVYTSNELCQLAGTNESKNLVHYHDRQDIIFGSIFEVIFTNCDSVKQLIVSVLEELDDHAEDGLEPIDIGIHLG